MCNFSSAIVLGDLNDFISPTLECIKPVEQLQLEQVPKELQVEKDGEGTAQNNGLKNGEKVEINLTDCLACSGCITSAESVLISIQSNTEFYKILDQRSSAISMSGSGLTGLSSGGSPYKLIVVSISSQSRASLAQKWGLSKDQIWILLNNMFVAMGVDYVFDIDFARDISLLASGCEFVERFTRADNLPVLASSCPGWVCYAEKTHPTILPHLDHTKSPQQVMGSLVKDFMAERLSLLPNQIHHTSIMPCYDKKLESSRADFHNDIYGCRDVDLVLSTVEVENMIVDRRIDLSLIPSTTLIPTPHPPFPLVKVGGTSGSSSGGALEWVLRYAVLKLYNISLTSLDIQQGLNGVTVTPGRNTDSTTVTFTPPGASEATLTFAYIYGFKNIQTLVRKLKRKTGLHFVEVMACPKGCINGGAQARSDPSLLPSKEWIQAVDDIYASSTHFLDPCDNASVMQVLGEWIGDGYVDALGDSREGLVKTKFHAVPNSFANPNAGLVVKW